MERSVARTGVGICSHVDPLKCCTVPPTPTKYVSLGEVLQTSLKLVCSPLAGDGVLNPVPTSMYAAPELPVVHTLVTALPYTAVSATALVGLKETEPQAPPFALE